MTTMSPLQLLLIFSTLASGSLLRSETLTDVSAASLLRNKLDQLRSRISSLETRISERAEDMKLKKKDDSINGKCNELSNQAENLRMEIEAQMKKKDELELRVYAAEAKIKELNLKLGSLRKISDEQSSLIRKIKHDIQAGEEKLMKLKTEASLASKGTNQEAMQFLKPYLTRISIASKPHVDILIHALKHYTRVTFEFYKRVMRSLTAFHTQVQEIVLSMLKGHEYTKLFADNDIVWYLASAIFALPAILIVNMYTGLISNKPQKLSHKNHSRRQGKRLRSGN